MIWFLILLAYAALIFFYKRGFSRYPTAPLSVSKASSTHSYTILIPVRNPSEAFYALLRQLQSQIAQSKEVEIIVVDDFSDRDIDLDDRFAGIKLLKLREYDSSLSARTHNKKRAIEFGVQRALGTYILCLDADVRLGDHWFQIITGSIEHSSPQFLAGIHRYAQNTSVLGRFLHLEQDVLSAISIGSLQMSYPTMCNGANMAFEKIAFTELGGYAGLHDIPGGDDLFLYHRMHRHYPKGVHYFKNLDSAVYSDSPSSIVDLIVQRNRWLGKSFSYENPWVLPQMILIFLANLIALGAYIFIFIFPWQCLCILALKWMTDYVLIRNLSGFFERRHSVEDVLFVLLYPIYAVMIPCIAAWRMIVSMISSHD